MTRRKRKPKQTNEQYTKDPFDLSKPVKGESEIHFKSLPTKIDKLNKIDKSILQDTESMKFVEYESTKYYLERFGDDIPRIALMMGVNHDRARKLIDDVYNIGYGLTANSSAEQRRRHKLRHMGVLDRIADRAMGYMEGEHGQLSPGEFKQISEVIRNCLADKAKMQGIGNTVIFEQFNTQNNFNLTPAQQELKIQKDQRVLLQQLSGILTTMDGDNILEGELVDND